MRNASCASPASYAESSNVGERQTTLVHLRQQQRHAPPLEDEASSPTSDSADELVTGSSLRLPHHPFTCGKAHVLSVWR